jgi:phenylacetate-CoA ligase
VDFVPGAVARCFVTASMISVAKDVYRQLPSSLRATAASGYGWYLRWWRYSRETDRLVEAALERDLWTPDEWQRYQEERLSALLHRAATRVPFYRRHWEERRAAGDQADWGDLSNWPLLHKDVLRRQPQAFVADDVSPGRMFRVDTSGTTGSPITTWRSRRTMVEWHALFEARWRLWYGVDRHMPWAMLGGQIVTPATQTAPPFWVWNAPMRQLYLSSLHLERRFVGAYLEAMRRYRVRHMYGYSSSMYWLATLARDEGLTAPRLDVVVSEAEPLLPHQRAVIGEVFGCSVFETYGMSEIVAAASECQHGALHMWPDAGATEVLRDDDDRPQAPGEVGRIVCTGLVNRDMPLIRYLVGDRGAFLPPSAPLCACGRRLPMFAGVEGRLNDNLVTADGRRIFWYNPQFYGLPIREGQVVQEEVGVVHVNVVPDSGFDESVERVITERMRQRLGDLNVVVHRLEAIPRDARGKFRGVINRLPPG